jgi:hypothetical protein
MVQPRHGVRGGRGAHRRGGQERDRPVLARSKSGHEIKALGSKHAPGRRRSVFIKKAPNLGKGVSTRSHVTGGYGEDKWVPAKRPKQYGKDTVVHERTPGSLSKPKTPDKRRVSVHGLRGGASESPLRKDLPTRWSQRVDK